MDNISNVMFILSGPKESNKYIYFAFAIIVYVCIISFNVTLILTISRERALHEPMYIFLCNLCFNGLYGTAGFYPKFFTDLLSDSYLISYPGCFLQAFVIYTSFMCEYTTLIIMAYDRYVAICRPLEYHTVMTTKTIVKLLLYSWIFPFFSLSNAILIANRLPLCGFHINRLYCVIWSVVRLSCVPTTVGTWIYGYVVLILSMAHAVLILYSYKKLIAACRKSKENQKKFMQTCLPHLLSLISFTIAILFDLMLTRYGSGDYPKSVMDFMQLEILVIPPLFNPIMYGLKLTEIRKRILRQHQGHKIKDSQHTRKR